VHSNTPKFAFPCCMEGCLKSSLTLKALHKHINRDHGATKQNRYKHLYSDIVLRCFLPSCATQYREPFKLIKHLKAHMLEGLSVDCAIKGCSRQYRLKSSFSSHLSRDHTSWFINDLKPGFLQPSKNTTEIALFNNTTDSEVEEHTLHNVDSLNESENECNPVENDVDCEETKIMSPGSSQILLECSI